MRPGRGPIPILATARQKYVEAAFGGDAEQTAVLAMVHAIEQALGPISAAAWMTAETKEQALVKLSEVEHQNWAIRTNGETIARLPLPVTISTAMPCVLADFEPSRKLEKIGRPRDKSEWSMSLPTVNAYYSPQLNSINFPAGILQPPFFDPRRDMALNYGGVGAVIGHEMTHGFDDQGRNFDGDGNLRDWWTPQMRRFEKRAACVADEYSGFTAVDDVKLNGRLTLGENTADNGGVRVAYMAMEKRLREERQDRRLYAGAALFPRLWADLVRKRTAGDSLASGPSPIRTLPAPTASTAVLSKHARISAGVSCKPAADGQRQACRVW